MPDMNQAYEALRKADAAGDTEGAKRIAAYIRSQPNEGLSPTEGTTPVAVHPVEMAAEGLQGARNWFKSNEPEEVSAAQVGGAVAGGAAGGAVAGAALPGALKVVGKVVPGPVGRLFSGLGDAASVIPLKERVVRGAGGGAAAGAVDITGRAFGAPDALTFGAEVAAGGVGETAASFLQHTGGKLARFAANVGYGNFPGAARALGGVLSPNKELNAKVAKTLQSRLFGDKTEGYLSTLPSSDNRIAVQEALRKADPTLNGAGPVNPAAPKLPGVTSGSPAAQENLARPASAIYRDRMYNGVTAAVKQGKAFSSTPEFAAFEQEMKTQVRLGNVSSSEAARLLQTLRADRVKNNPAVLDRYAETVDDRIRQWGKPAETGGQTGAAAVDAKVASAVREKLRQAYNGYTQRLGLGDVESRYRNAYSQEMLAEAKDKLPAFFSKLESTEQFGKFARNLARDPQGKAFVQKALAQHLAQQEPEAVGKEFTRLQSVLAQSGLVTAKDLEGLRTAAATVERATKSGEGSAVRLGQRLQQMVLMVMARNAAAEGGAAAAGRGQEGG